jgi:hypothetical protein
MSPEDHALTADDPVVRAFVAGILAWERPPGTTEVPPAQPGGNLRGRGVVRTRGGQAGREQPSHPPVGEDDALVARFRDGAHTWEYPMDRPVR